MQVQTVQRKTQQFFDNTFEQVEKNIQTQAKTTVQSVTSQISGKTPSDQNQDHGTSETGVSAILQNQLMPSDSSSEVVKDFYEPSDPSVFALLKNQILPKAGEMNPEEQAKYKKLRSELHQQTYYTGLIQRKSTEQEHQEEEQQEEEKKEMEALQLEEKKKQDDDIAIRMQTNRAEQFPGASG